MDTLENWVNFHDNSGTSEALTANTLNEYTAVGGTSVGYRLEYLLKILENNSIDSVLFV